MKKGKLDNGFEFVIDEQVLNDMRFFDLLAQLDENPLAFPKAVTMLLGDEQKNKLYKYIEDENGRVPVEQFSELMTEIFDKAGSEVKNS